MSFRLQYTFSFFYSTWMTLGYFWNLQRDVSDKWDPFWRYSATEAIPSNRRSGNSFETLSTTWFMLFILKPAVSHHTIDKIPNLKPTANITELLSSLGLWSVLQRLYHSSPVLQHCWTENCWMISQCSLKSLLKSNYSPYEHCYRI